MLVTGLNQSALRAVLADDEDTYVYYPTLEEPTGYQPPSYQPYEEETYVHYPTLEPPQPEPYAPEPYQPPPVPYQPPAPIPQGGDYTFRYPECDWNTNQVRDVYQDSLGNYQYRNYHTQPGACGALEVTGPSPTYPTVSCSEDVTYFDSNVGQNIRKHGGYFDGSGCVYAFDPVSTPAQIPSCREDVTYWDPNAGSNIRKHGGYYESYHPLADSQGCVYAFDRVGPPIITAQAAPIQSQTQSLVAPITVTQQFPTEPEPFQPFPFLPPLPFIPPQIPHLFVPAPVTSQPIVTYPLVQQPPVIIHQPAGAPITNTNTNNNNNTNTLTVSVPAPQVITHEVVRLATVDQPRVVEVAGSTIVKELPKTGLPLLAWTAAAFIPLGFKLRRFRKTQETITPNFIWEDRQFDKLNIIS